jgi:hypothetical protein
VLRVTVLHGVCAGDVEQQGGLARATLAASERTRENEGHVGADTTMD